MSKEVRLRIATAMIVFSFVIIFVGLLLDTKEHSSKLSSINGNVIASSDESSISITTMDGKKPESSGEKNHPTNSENILGNSEPNYGTSNENNSDPITAMPGDNNVSLRNEIQNKYGITIKYGSETNNYNVGGLSTIPLTDKDEIFNALNNLNSAMALYPNGFFQEMNNYGVPLTIYLIKRYSAGNVTGVTDSSTNHVLISIATDFNFLDSFTHESFHYIDNFIYIRGGRYTSWNNLNPGGFSYGNINNNYSYDHTFSEEAFFVNNYAQTDEYEDRASTFEYMMSSTKASCLNYGKNVWLKAKYMAEQIDYFYSSVNPNAIEYWERYIY